MTLRRTAGFTLVEMVVTIGIIILLAALTLSVSVAVVRGSEVRQTETTLTLLDSAIQEWQRLADRQVTYGRNGEPPPQSLNDQVRYEIQEPAANDDITLETSAEATNWLFAIISKPEPVKQILARVNQEFVAQEMLEDPGDSSREFETYLFRDAWGNPIYAVFPGRTWTVKPGWDDEDYYDARDVDGTIRTETEIICGIASNRQICFVSAGPDGELGDLTRDADPQEFEFTEDNIYSYEPIPPPVDPTP